MKNFIALVLVLSSFSAFSSNAGVLEAMKSMFRSGTYFGISPANDDVCTVRFQYFQEFAVITATSQELTVSRVVPANSNYRFQAGRRELLSSDNKSTFRSLAVDEIQTYTVTAEINEYGEEVPVECTIPLE